jgi:hypothetical protein
MDVVTVLDIVVVMEAAATVLAMRIDVCWTA